ncbi:MAG TPA: hypothetical protein VHO70_08285 [Chitinispirillaceae bacterium]|nr:hypothetical protein [Chitinispirillaceae bacterium]
MQIEILPYDALKIFLHNTLRSCSEESKKKGLPPFLAGDNPFEKFLALYATRTARYTQIVDVIAELGTGSKDENAEIELQINKRIHSCQEIVSAI